MGGGFPSLEPPQSLQYPFCFLGRDGALALPPSCPLCFPRAPFPILKVGRTPKVLQILAARNSWDSPYDPR